MSPIPLGILALAGAAGGGSYELIESNILTSSASSVTFSSIPQDYKHLQIRAVARGGSGNALTVYPYLNSDTASNYSFHRLRGTGSSISSFGGGSTVPATTVIAAEGTSTIFGAFTIDILDYQNTSKNSTITGLSGFASSAINRVEFGSAAWYNPSAVTSITLTVSSDAYQAGSRFSLYGIRG